MNGKHVYGVLLTDEAYAEIGAVLEPYVSKGPIGKYIYCLAVDASGPYFQMSVEHIADDKSTSKVDVSVPHRFVKCFVVFPPDRKIGFT